jgi:hypothetical protein
MQHIIIPHLRPPNLNPLPRQPLHIRRPQIHNHKRHRLPAPQRILALHPDVRAALAAEVAVHALDPRRVVAELRV